VTLATAAAAAAAIGSAAIRQHRQQSPQHLVDHVRLKGVGLCMKKGMQSQLYKSGAHDEVRAAATQKLGTGSWLA
jgi:hypothetical protein